jgi:uncharacterized protein YodC (DUF2158 family)
MNFEVGDLVWLKSGGPAMSIAFVDTFTREIRCTWFAMVDGSQQLQTRTFPVETLTGNDPVSHAPGPRTVEPDYKVYEEGDD